MPNISESDFEFTCKSCVQKHRDFLMSDVWLYCIYCYEDIVYDNDYSEDYRIEDWDR